MHRIIKAFFFVFHVSRTAYIEIKNMSLFKKSVALTVGLFAVAPTEVKSVGVMAKLQGVTAEGHFCDHECQQELRKLHDQRTSPKVGHAAEEPLILTKLLQKGVSTEEMQKQSLVSPQIGNYSSYSGFFTTDSDPKHDNNMFFW